tara:strand:- start:2641 stop:2916 length:276 start_codon:yes stop_codon:yes gene_type:complete
MDFGWATAVAGAIGVGGVGGVIAKANTIKKARTAFDELNDVIEKLREVGEQWELVYSDNQLTPEEMETFGQSVVSLAKEATEFRDKVKEII